MILSRLIMYDFLLIWPNVCRPRPRLELLFEIEAFAVWDRAPAWSPWSDWGDCAPTNCTK